MSTLCKDVKYAHFANYFDVHTEFDLKPWTYFKNDRIHPNWVGSMKLAEMIQKHFMSVASKGNMFTYIYFPRKTVQLDK